jgi:L-rhamnose mutarotase
MPEIKPIARWARVPNEILSGVQQIGLVAFHKDGIKEVQYVIQTGKPSSEKLAELLADWGKTTSQYDLNKDGIVDSADLSLLLSNPNWSGTAAITVTESRFNNLTKIEEYSFDFDFNTLQDGESITVTAKVIANDGSELLFDRPYSVKDISYPSPASYADDISVSETGIHCLTLEKESVSRVYKVSLDGSDSNDGITTPFRTFEKAILTAIPGDTIQFGNGEFELVYPRTKKPATGTSKWITVKGNGNTIFVTPGYQTFSSKFPTRWVNITLDMGRIGYIAGTDHWWDNCKFLNPSNEAWFNDGVEKQGPPDPSIPICESGKDSAVFRKIGGEHFFTDCHLSNNTTGFNGTPMARNSTIKNIWGDAFAMANGIFNCSIDNFAGYLTTKHSDIYQMWEVKENVIMYGVSATNVKSVQGIFCRPVMAKPTPEFNPETDRQCYLANTAFINNTILHEPKPSTSSTNTGGPPYSQIKNKCLHVLLINHKLPYQKFFFGGETEPGWEQRNMEDVILRDCDLHWSTIEAMKQTGPKSKWKPIEGGYENDGVKAYGCYNSVAKS